MTSAITRAMTRAMTTPLKHLIDRLLHRAAPPLFACAILLAINAPHTEAQEAVLLGPDLNPQSVALASYNSNGVQLYNRVDKQPIPLSDVLRLTLRTPTQEPNAPRPNPIDDRAAIAQLVDGQALVGRLLGPGDDGESIRLELHQTQREVTVPLDNLMSLALKPNVTLPTGDADREDDLLLLATGETLLGFVEAVDAEAVDFIVGDADDPIRIPLDRIDALAIANNLEPAQPTDGKTLTRVTLEDGSTLLLRDAELVPALPDEAARLTGTSTLSMSLPVVSFDLKEVSIIEPVIKGRQLLPLTSLSRRVLAGGEVFGVPMPPSDLPDHQLRLHAPIDLSFELPDGATRLAFFAALRLDESIPNRRRDMAGCILVVYDGKNELSRTTLRPDTPPTRINAPLRGETLRLVLEPGINGPVLDRVTLFDAELLVITK